MPQNDRNVIRIPGNNSPIREVTRFARLIWRLLNDERVSPLLKLIPLGGVVYLLFPFDVPGPVDDAGVIGMSLYLFVELCPQDVVEEHRRALDGTLDVRWKDKTDDDNTVDAEWKEK
ncbi:MAG: hypothetical protein Fur0018_20440 [Anaerolineales bacterium]